MTDRLWWSCLLWPEPEVQSPLQAADLEKLLEESVAFCLLLPFHPVRRRWATLIIGGSTFSKQVLDFLDFLEEVEQLE